MEGAEGNSEKLNISGWRVNARDLIPKLKNEDHFTNETNQHNEKAEKNEGKIELNLGLSMNGRFGIDPSTKKLKRSSSVSDLASDDGSAVNGGGTTTGGEARGDHSREAARRVNATLARASSLPPEMEELWRRRCPGKELESARSMEARKKRMEKMKNVRKRGVYLSGDGVENGGGLHKDENGGVNMRFLDNGGVVNGSENWMMAQSSQGSMMGSQRDSAGKKNSQRQVTMGANQNTMTRSSSSRQILNKAGVGEPAVRAADNDNRAEKQKLLKNALLNMPHVSTGPNHSRVEGILYRYRRADELKIVCVCHGLFLSPAEFVRHGGGGDVAQPLKHIVVNPFPLFQV